MRFQKAILSLVTQAGRMALPSVFPAPSTITLIEKSVMRAFVVGTILILAMSGLASTAFYPAAETGVSHASIAKPPTPKPTPEPAAQGTVKATITVDNGYGFGFGTSTGITPPTNYFGSVDNCSSADIFSCATGPESYTVPASLNGYVYIAAWSDEFVTQGVLAQFTDGTTTVYSGDPRWEAFSTGMNFDPCKGPQGGPPVANINAQIAIANAAAGGANTSKTWVNVASGKVAVGEDNNASKPPTSLFPTVCGIGSAAKWMWYNPDPIGITRPFETGARPLYPASESQEYLIFRLGPLDQIFHPCPPGVCCAKKPTFAQADNASTSYTASQFPGAVTAATCYSPTPNDFVLVVVDASGTHYSGPNTNSAAPMYHGPNAKLWTRANLGQVFGVTFDDQGNIYVAATVAYQPPDVFGPGGSGAVYKIDALTGLISTFAQLPNTNNTGLGNIAFDCKNKQFFVTNLEDGRIYRINTAGAVQANPYDHGVAGRTNAGLTPTIPDNSAQAFTQLGRRTWAVKVHNGRVYYSVWWEDAGHPDPVQANEIWSVALNATGDFDLSPGSVRREFKIDPLPSQNYSNPVSDMAFSPEGYMLLGERGMNDPSTPTPHQSRALEYACCDFEQVGIGWLPTNHSFKVGVFNNGTNTAGGVDYDYTRPSTATTGLVWATGDALQFGPQFIYGLQGLPPSGGAPSNSILIDLNGIITQPDKTEIGDVAISCVEVPETCEPCEKLSLIFTPAQGGDAARCCWNVSVRNDCTRGFPSVTGVKITPQAPVTITSATAAPGWSQALGANVVWSRPGGIPPGPSSTPAGTVCFDPHGAFPQVLLVEFVTDKGEMICGREVRLPCPTTGDICGMKWNDLNGDGKKDANEPGLPGWQIIATGPTGTIFMAVTDAQGNYCFENLPPGKYTIGEISQNGWTETAPAAPGTYMVNVTLGTVIQGLNFGNRLCQFTEPCTGTICGMKWNDRNGDGKKDANEPGLANWTINLQGPGGLTLSTKTDERGNYCFTKLPAGPYTVSEVGIPGWLQTLPPTPPPPAGRPGAHTARLECDQSVSNINFGNICIDRLRCPELAGPDLTVGSLLVDPRAVSPGGQVVVSFTIMNQGTVEAGSANHQVRLVVGEMDRLLTTVTTDTLAPGVLQPFRVIVTIPRDLMVALPATVQIRVRADANNAVRESDEDNNTADFLITLQ